MDAGSFDVIAAAGGLVTDVASGRFDRCFFDPREPDRINCQGGGREVANFVDIQQDDGLVARYFHLKKDTVTVRKDQRVACGQVLGKVGSSGRSSAPHLHFELRRNDEIVDPYAETLDLGGRAQRAECQVPEAIGEGAMRFLAAIGLALGGLLAGGTAFASHDASCQLLGTSAQRAGTRACNPRQECINSIPGNVHGPARNAAEATCDNTMPSSGTCPTTETYNPRQECLAKLPPTPAVSITSVDGGAAGGNKTYAGRPDMMRVQGSNVGMAGNTIAWARPASWSASCRRPTARRRTASGSRSRARRTRKGRSGSSCERGTGTPRSRERCRSWPPPRRRPRPCPRLRCQGPSAAGPKVTPQAAPGPDSDG